MAFTLEVEFSGLCQYLIQRDGKQVGIVMPDARQNGRPVRPHDFEASKKYLVHHVGYLRYNLADAGVPIQIAGRAGTPSYEVDPSLRLRRPRFRSRFRRADATAEVGSADADGVRSHGFDLAWPLQRKAAGQVTHANDSARWEPNDSAEWRVVAVQPSLQKNGKRYLGEFAGFAIWRRLVLDDELVLRVRDWSGGDKDVIRLRPYGRDRVVRLKIANLCSENPLEWPELYRRVFTGDSDDDFKWFYFLWQDRSQTGFEKLLVQIRPLFPCPRLLRRTVTWTTVPGVSLPSAPWRAPDHDYLYSPFDDTGYGPVNGRYALVITLDHVEPAFYTGWRGRIDAATKDREAIGRLLKDAEFEKRELTNEFATRDGVRENLAELALRTVAATTSSSTSRGMARRFPTSTPMSAAFFATGPGVFTTVCLSTTS